MGYLHLEIHIVNLQYTKTQKSASNKNINIYVPIGTYKFYPEQNKLIKEATEITLSKKECEL